jgi:hypothetical protein
MGMTASLRVARSGGDAEFRAVLCLPVIPKAPGAEYRMNKLFGHAETAIQRLFSFAGTRGDTRGPRANGMLQKTRSKNPRASPCYAGSRGPRPRAHR